MAKPKGPQIAYHAEPQVYAKGRLAELDDAALIATTLEGEDLAFEVLMERYLPLVTGTLAARTRCLADAEDLAQEVFLTAFRSLARLKDPTRFRPWLMRIVQSRLIDFFRMAGRRPLMVSGEADPEHGESAGLLARAADPSAGPDERVTAAETHGLILREIERMDEKYRAIVLMRLVGEQTSEEIARRLGLRPSGVRMRLFRAMRLLRKALRRLQIG